MNTPDRKPTPRKPYHAPVLELYGHIKDLTRIVGGTRGANDGVPMGNKTGV